MSYHDLKLDMREIYAEFCLLVTIQTENISAVSLVECLFLPLLFSLSLSTVGCRPPFSTSIRNDPFVPAIRWIGFVHRSGSFQFIMPETLIRHSRDVSCPVALVNAIFSILLGH